MDSVHHHTGLSVPRGISLRKAPAYAVFTILALLQRAEVFCFAGCFENHNGGCCEVEGH